ncbi:MAG TPA: PadR family transcriptional regulator [Candidatus Nanoarchaeia archaeon]|nr:PadR family transcriptional regulator [Candidatus Nanoarchaeia archaeon]
MQISKEEKTSSNWMKEAQKGYIRVAALIIINKKPSHGYEIMKEVKEKTGGFWTPTAGGMYPILRDLETSKYIVGEWETQKNRKLKTYKITDSGRQILERVIVKQNEITANMGALFREFARDVLNVETEHPAPAIPSVFSAFLEEGQGDAGIEKLKKQRKQIQKQISVMQQRLKILEKRIAEEKIKQKSRKK